MRMHAETIGVDLQAGLFVPQAAARPPRRLDENIVQTSNLSVIAALVNCAPWLGVKIFGPPHPHRVFESVDVR
jgi:hypothetical protein